MEFRILGPLEVVEDGRAIPLGGVRQRALLALLLLHVNETLGTDRLIDELWGERPPTRGGQLGTHSACSLLQMREGKQAAARQTPWTGLHRWHIRA